MYLDYGTYKIYGGTEIADENTFINRTFLAEAVLNRITFGRLEKLLSKDGYAPSCVLVAMVDMLDYEARTSADGGIKASETVSKHSITYANPAESVESAMENRARMYLRGSEYEWLLYRGVLPMDLAEKEG